MYGQTILRVAGEFSALPFTAVAAGMIDSGASLRRRIGAIAQPPRRSATAMLLAALGCITIVCTMFTSPRVVAAADQSAPPSAPTPNGLVRRVYDVRDLLISIPDVGDFVPDMTSNPPRTSMPAPADLAADVAAARQDKRVNDFIRQVETSVDSASWQINGPGTITYDKSGRLTIDQTPANQEAVAALFASLRKQRGIMITVETHFMTGSGAVEQWAAATAGRWMRRDGYDVWSRPLNDADLQAIIADMEKHAGNTLINAPRMTIYAGQRGYLYVGTENHYLPDRAAASDRGDATLLSGVLVDAQVAVSGDHRNVTLTLKAQLQFPLNMENVLTPAAASEQGTVTTQIPHVRSATVDTTVTVGDKQAVLFRLDAVEHPTSTAHPANEPVYCWVRPTILVQRDRESR